jgi:DNA-binding response OmpR family regulator
MSAVDATNYRWQIPACEGGLVTFGVIEREEPLLGQLIALAFQAEGHSCLVLKNAARAARVLHTTRLDAIVVDIQMPGLNGVDWLETLVATWPDLPSRTLLLTQTALTPGEAVRIKRLGAEVVSRPRSMESVKLLVRGRLQKALSNALGASLRGQEQHAPVPFPN